MDTRVCSRLGASMLLGAGVTTLVLLLMHALIEPEEMFLEDRPPGGTLTFLPVIEDEPPERDRQPPDKPPQPDEPPPPPPLADFEDGGVVLTDDFLPPHTDPPTGPQGPVMSDGDALPVVKVTPVYPTRAAERGIEGHVLVEFTIDKLGRVVDVSIVDADPRGVFDRAALKAVERFRYKPRVVNGKAIPVSGVQHLVSFELNE